MCMIISDLLKKMYLMRKVISGCFNTQSEIYSYIQSYQGKESIVAFSQKFKALLTRANPILDKDANNRLTTRFALYLEAFVQLTIGNLKPMWLYLEKHNDVTVFLCRHWRVLENLYYDFVSQGNDIILLDEYSLLLDEQYKVIRVDLIKDTINMSKEPFKKEFLYGFFKDAGINKDSFFGKNQQEREQFIESMSSFFSSFHI